MSKRAGLLLIAVLTFSACGRTAAVVELPTAHVIRPTVTAVVLRRTPPATRLPTPTLEVTPTTPLPTPTFEITPTPTPGAAQSALAAPLDQYRSWMEEARTVHPYGESVDMMWEVMLCESSGEAHQIAGSYYGLFQYTSATWSSDWNPYRTSPILDPRAQIFATAKAWQDGNQHWWGCYPR